MPRFVNYLARALVAVLAGVVVGLLVAASRASWDTALLAGWDAGVAIWLVITYVTMGRADPKHTSLVAQAMTPGTLRVLTVVILTSAAGLFGAVALAGQNAGRGQTAQSLHLAAAAVAVFGAWLLVHTEFGFYYARLYYDEVKHNVSAGGVSGTLVEFRKGLEFPEKELVDYWDFMYYSFTIAMCYQTSDVTVTAWWMRRVTLFHSILSFAYVLVILGFTVNAIGNIL
ncbi:MAG: DUF1345 domain-containing protein [Anaerolineae bacterium]